MTEAGAAEDGTAYLQARTDFFAGILGLSSEIGQVRHSETAEESLNGQVNNHPLLPKSGEIQNRETRDSSHFD